jgi:RNA polymerase sigma-70 factor (ECF subfamily)
MAESIPQTTQLHKLLERMRGGDQSARDELVRRVCRRMEHLAHKMLRGYPNVARWVQTDDVLQSALMRLLRTLQQLQPDSMRSFYGLAAEHVRRELLDLARQLYGPQGMGAHHHSLGPDQDSRPGWEPTAASDSAEELDRWRRFHEEVEKLPTELREVVSLVFYHGWTQAEVAELFQVTERTIRRRWQEALLALRAALSGQMPEQ